MEFSVKLVSLPAEFAVPERLRDRLSFDPSKGQLSYRGFMTKCTYDELSALCDDPDYHRALEQLFVLTSAEVTPRRKRSFPAAILLATIATAALAALVIWTMTRRTAEKAAGAASSATVSTAS